MQVRLLVAVVLEVLPSNIFRYLAVRQALRLVPVPAVEAQEEQVRLFTEQQLSLALEGFLRTQAPVCTVLAEPHPVEI
jgi:hypothetical protein